MRHQSSIMLRLPLLLGLGVAAGCSSDPSAETGSGPGGASGAAGGDGAGAGTSTSGATGGDGTGVGTPSSGVAGGDGTGGGAPSSGAAGGGGGGGGIPGRMAIGDLAYSGAFRLGSGDFGVSHANYAVGTIAYHPANHSLFIVGFAQGTAIAEFAIPTPGMQQVVADLPVTETPLQGFVDIVDSGSTGNPQEIDRITGMLVVDDALIVNAETWYDAAADNTHTTLIVRDANDLAGAVDGYFALDGAAHSAGYMSPIPPTHQAAFGAQYLTGWSSVFSIVSRYSVGPSLWTFDPFDLVSSPAGASGRLEADVFMEFPFDDHMLDERAVEMAGQGTEGPFTPASPLWNILSKGRYGFIVPGTKTFAVIGSNGGIASGIGYKAIQDDGNECGGPCPYAADDRYNYYWLFDVDEILAAENAYDPRPYDYGEWSLPFDDGGAHAVIGGAFDPIEGVLYIALSEAGQVGDYDRPPLILTYETPTF